MLLFGWEKERFTRSGPTGHHTGQHVNLPYTANIPFSLTIPLASVNNHTFHIYLYLHLAHVLWLTFNALIVICLLLYVWGTKNENDHVMNTMYLYTDHEKFHSFYDLSNWRVVLDVRRVKMMIFFLFFSCFFLPFLMKMSRDRENVHFLYTVFLFFKNCLVYATQCTL